MKAVDWMVDYIIKQGCTDVFGIPGVVVMDFLYAVDSRKPDITPHLTYHEQGGSYAACGYAQSTGKLGVAYATRGPGFTNMITAISDAYYDSLPTLFITAHSAIDLNYEMRVLNNQEIDTVCMVRNVTKYAKRIDCIEEFQSEVSRACSIATSGRKGPVFLDIYNGLFSKEVTTEYEPDSIERDNSDLTLIIDAINNKLNKSSRPVILIGNGARSEFAGKLLDIIANKFNIPVLSSRSAQDIATDSNKYFGFVGSRATRYSNYILSKADLIISLGNRMAFPVKSKSFSPVVNNCEIIRVDIDGTELLREVPNSKNYIADVQDVLLAMKDADFNYEGSESWIGVCERLRETLDKWDSDNVIKNIMNLMLKTDKESPFVCDVGNHSFWETTAHAYSKVLNRIMYSGSFGTLGSALPKAIGAYYATHKPVMCFTGDQGFQFNIQELQYISVNKLPVTIVIMNNSSSGMIMEREIAKYGDNLVHTTTDDGYSYPDFEKVAYCYGIEYKKVQADKDVIEYDDLDLNKPKIIEMLVDVNTELRPSLPIGKPCQDLSPELPRELYDELNDL